TRGDLCFAGSFVIGTSRQDGFMHYRNVVCLLACSLFLSSAWGQGFKVCSSSAFWHESSVNGIIMSLYSERLVFS
ncbi:hypothetical protein ACSLOH_30275, partial [Escherichia coli]|uniref:hypothetical protein n=1 Tax=Escherichia coli TaxID=562 RepID=UPI003EE0CCBB